MPPKSMTMFQSDWLTDRIVSLSVNVLVVRVLEAKKAKLLENVRTEAELIEEELKSLRK